jgi:hypothetical protein
LKFIFRVRFARLCGMNNSSEVSRLAKSISGLVETFTEIVNEKVKEANDVRASADVALQQQARHPIIIETWVGKKGVAEHFKISVRTADNYVKTAAATTPGLKPLADQLGQRFQKASGTQPDPAPVKAKA